MPDKRAFASSERGDEEVVADHVGAQLGRPARPGQREVAGRTIGGDTEHAADEQRGRHQTGDCSTQLAST